MRFLAATVATGLVSLAAAKPSAAIYEFNSRSSSSRDAPLSVWPEEARLVLAQRLGVGRFYDLDVQSPNDHKLEVLGKLSASDSIFGDEEEGRLLLSIGGLEDSIGFLSAGLTPSTAESMSISPAIGSCSASGLVSDLAAQKQSITREALHRVEFGVNFCALSSRRAADMLKSAVTNALTAWSSSCKSTLPMSLCKIFAEADADHRQIVTSYLMLSKLASSGLGSFSFCHIGEMERTISIFGADSKETSAALEVYREAVVSLLSGSLSTTLLLTPPTSPDLPCGMLSAPSTKPRRTKRTVTEEPLKMPQSATVRPLAVSAKACHASEGACNNVTASCSSHGKCIKANKDCWQCACGTTVVRNEKLNGNKTTVWAGNACQKKDVSVPFNLFLLLGIGIVTTIIWAIGLLYSVGEEPLPSVLAAGVAPPKRS